MFVFKLCFFRNYSSLYDDMLFSFFGFQAVNRKKFQNVNRKNSGIHFIRNSTLRDNLPDHCISKVDFSRSNGNLYLHPFIVRINFFHV